jgi:hypothetical protein
MTAVELLANRLEAFFANWEAARTSNHVSTLPNRMTHFFERFRSLSTPHASPELELPATLGKQLDFKTLETALQSLRAPLARARSAGAFLNVWSAAGLKRDEVRNTAVLASLLDPQSYPEAGPDFLWAFLQRATHSGTASLLQEAEVRRGYTVRTEEYPLGQADSRVDLSIEGHNFLLMIEVKIDADEGTAQLSRYDDVLRKKARALGKRPALIYLSPRPPRNLPAETIHATWTDIVFAARQVSRMSISANRSLVGALLLHFAVHATAFT